MKTSKSSLKAFALVGSLAVFGGPLVVPSTPLVADLLDEEETAPLPKQPGETEPPKAPALQPAVPASKAPAPGAKPAAQKPATAQPAPSKAPAAKPAKKPSGQKPDKNDPVLFESKGLKGLREQGMIELMDDVVVTQADMRLEADQAKVYFDEKKNDVTKVVAEGNVKLFKTDTETGERIKAFSNQIVFNNKDRTIVMEGNARLWRGADLVRGKKITYEMDSGWIKADRVAGEVYPEDTKGTGTPPAEQKK